MDFAVLGVSAEIQTSLVDSHLPADEPLDCTQHLDVLPNASRTHLTVTQPIQAITINPNTLIEAFPEFQLVRQLGAGAFGTVFLARQNSLADRLVALKVSADLFGETQTLARLQHTHIMPIYSVHRARNLHALCMPYFGGTTLADLYVSIHARETLPDSGRYLVNTLESRAVGLCEAPPIQLEPDRLANQEIDLERLLGRTKRPESLSKLGDMSYVQAILQIGEQIALGLAHAHERGILHRDIKPANILLTDEGQPLILDFNLAEDAQDPAMAGRGGTIAYMSPEQMEQFAGKPVTLDVRTDIYSLGLVLYQLLTGQSLFPTCSGSVEKQIPYLQAKREKAQINIRTHNPSVSPSVQAIVRKCLAYSREDRYPTAKALAEDLRRQREHQPLVHVHEPSLRERWQKFKRRHPKLVSPGSCITLVAVLCLASVPFWIQSWKRQQASLLAAEHDRERATIDQFREMSREARQFLASGTDHNQWRIHGLQKGLQALDTVGAYREDWPNFRHLPGWEKDNLRSETAELVTLLANSQLTGENRLAEKSGTFHRLSDTLKNLSPAGRGKGFRDALVQLELGKSAEARQILQDWLRDNPDDPDAWFLKGRAHRALGELPEAQAAFSTVIALRPKFAPAYFQRFQLASELRDPAAEQAIAQAVALAPDDDFLKLEQARYLGSIKKYTQALGILQPIVEKDNAQPRVYLTAATIYGRIKDTSNARHYLQKGLSTPARDVDDWLARGLALMQSKPLEALESLQQAEKLAPTAIAPLRNQAYIYAAILKQPEKAVLVLQRLEQHHPQFIDGLCSLGIYLARSGQIDAAIAKAKQSLEVSDKPFTHYRVACVYALAARERPGVVNKAIYHLARSLRGGYGFDFIPTDTDLDPIRTAREFKEIHDLVAKLEKLQEDL